MKKFIGLLLILSSLVNVVLGEMSKCNTIADEVSLFFKNNPDKHSIVVDSKNVPKLFEILNKLSQRIGCESLKAEVIDLEFVRSTLQVARNYSWQIGFDYGTKQFVVDYTFLSSLSDAELESILTYCYFRDVFYQRSMIKLPGSCLSLLPLPLVIVLLVLKKIKLGKFTKDGEFLKFVLAIFGALLFTLPITVWLWALVWKPYFEKEWDLSAANLLDNPAILVEAHDKLDKSRDWGFWKNLLFNPRKISKEQRAEYIKNLVEIKNYIRGISK